MGQYYKAVVLSTSSSSRKAEIVAAYDPCTYGMFSKLTEHSWIPNSFVQTVERFFMSDEKHYKHRLVWAGDYADPEPGGEDDLYDLCESKETETPHSQFPKLSDTWSITQNRSISTNGNKRKKTGGRYTHSPYLPVRATVVAAEITDPKTRRF